MKFTDFNPDEDLVFSEYSHRKISLSSKNKPIRFQIPRMYMPFGISGFTPEVGPTKWNVDFSMKGYDEDGNYVKKFFDFLKKLEEKVLQHVQENDEKIFSRSISKFELEDIFNSNIKESLDREPKFRVKVDTDGTLIRPPIFDMNNEQVKDEATNGLYQKHTGTAMVELHSIYFMNKRFGLTWKMYQMKIFEPQRLKGFQFNDEEPEQVVKGFQFVV
jgi:hypothetical protein